MIPASQMERITKEIVVRAPRARVWKAVSNVAEFSKWFRVKAEGEFRSGERVQMVSTYPGHEGASFYVDIVDMEPERRLSWRWQAAAAEDPATLVVFDLEDVEGGTRVRVTESGFERVSAERRAKVFQGNRRGWELQSANLRSYVEQG